MTTFSEIVRKRLTQVLSLPERTIRSIVSIAVGVSTLLTETIFPESLRGTTTYRVTIGMMQQYILEKIAGMEDKASEEGVELSDDFAQRKLAGTALEAAGLLTMGFSPLWVFAIAGDAAGGSKLYLQRLVQRLKENDLIPQDEEANELVDVLEAIQGAASQSALAVDMPPLSRDDLVRLVDDIKDGYVRTFEDSSNLLPSLDELWARMEQLTKREGVSIERLGGAMAMEAVAWSKKSAGMVLAAGQTGIQLFDEMILDSYKQTLSRAAEQGVEKVIGDHMRPFLLMAKEHFDTSRQTWTEKLLNGKAKNPSGN
jgi:hypothetical protein